MTEQLHFHFSLSCIGEGNGNPLQYSCLENPRDSGAWWAAIYGIAQSWTTLKRLSSSSSKMICIHIFIFTAVTNLVEQKKKKKKWSNYNLLEINPNVLSYWRPEVLISRNWKSTFLLETVDENPSSCLSSLLEAAYISFLVSSPPSSESQCDI